MTAFQRLRDQLRSLKSDDRQLHDDEAYLIDAVGVIKKLGGDSL